MLAGGLVYSAGALVYGLKRPNLIPVLFGFHELWYLFVVAGSACHFWAVLHYVARSHETGDRLRNAVP